jgi:stage II sporulation protein AA (anti-sigma F factor antagonist)
MEQTFVIRARLTETAEILDLSGDLTRNAEEALMNWRSWHEGLEDGRKWLVLNFRNVGYVNSGGIALLIRLTRTGFKAGYRTFAIHVSSHYQKLFRMVGLMDSMMIYPDEYSVMQRIGDEEGGG